MSINKSTQAYRNKIKYVGKWTKLKTKDYMFHVNKEKDKDLIAFLDSLPNKQGFIKDLIREAMIRAEK